MALTGYLFDTSVIHRLAASLVADRVDALGVQRPLYRCAVTDLEVLRSSVSPADYEARRAALISAYSELPITPDVMARALDTQRRMAAVSRHRGLSLADLVVAACAAAHDAVVVHYDSDYDLIAEVTGQPVEWIVPAGSVD
ncbi:PIN domain-containing protein [Jiangella anatolica]|uniref:Ribonuclease VapC n=1 Tax=Jiangella anatolica TaxID=2670374 RepID=A0A2W2CAN4_9ACTN|nr:PIN domain-containing protein [Jiangella anatolica]PZF82846.1 VapC toxin family PIN domain ribonuclease [Jiangella anatolica]